MTVERYAPLIGQSFSAAPSPDAPELAALVLKEAERSPRAGDNGRPFSLVFEAPADVRLEQETYWLSAPDGEPEPIFLVPIGPRQYEAVFN